MNCMRYVRRCNRKQTWQERQCQGLQLPPRAIPRCLTHAHVHNRAHAKKHPSCAISGACFFFWLSQMHAREHACIRCNLVDIFLFCFLFTSFPNVCSPQQHRWDHNETGCVPGGSHLRRAHRRFSPVSHISIFPRCVTGAAALPAHIFLSRANQFWILASLFSSISPPVAAGTLANIPTLTASFTSSTLVAPSLPPSKWLSSFVVFFYSSSVFFVVSSVQRLRLWSHPRCNHQHG